MKVKRFILCNGKFGYYFHDTIVKVDYSLKMVLDKLNWSEKLRERNNFLINEINQLKRKIELLKEVKKQ